MIMKLLHFFFLCSMNVIALRYSHTFLLIAWAVSTHKSNKQISLVQYYFILLGFIVIVARSPTSPLSLSLFSLCLLLTKFLSISFSLDIDFSDWRSSRSNKKKNRFKTVNVVCPENFNIS